MMSPQHQLQAAVSMCAAQDSLCIILYAMIATTVTRVPATYDEYTL